MKTSTKLLLGSWVRTFVASVSASLAVVGKAPWTFNTSHLLAILVSAGAATGAAIYNYFSPRDPRFGKTIVFVAKAALLASTEANVSAPIKEDTAAFGNYLESLASENTPVAPVETSFPAKSLEARQVVITPGA